ACLALGKGRNLYPDEKRLVNKLRYTIQEWLRYALDKQGEDKARELAAAVKKEHAGLDGTDGLIAAHVRNAVEKHLRSGKYAEARAALERHTDLLSKDEKLKLIRLVVDRQARERLDKKDWKGALAIYTTALADMPGDGHLTDNAIAVWDRQA